MVKLYIVEDEMLLRELIKNAFDYHSIGVEIVGEADNSITALEQIRILEPDIVFMDINIPYINGLELSTMLRELYPRMRIIIITGYSEFEYARQAISIGISDYICKPVDNENLQRIVSRIRDEIIRERHNQETLDDLMERDINARLVQRNQYLAELATGQIRDKQEYINTRFAYFGLPFNAKAVCCAVIGGINQPSEKRDECREVVNRWFLKRWSEEKFIIFWVYSRMVVLLDGNVVENIDFHALAEHIRMRTGISPKIVIGSIEKYYGGMPISYGNALKILEDYYVSEEVPVVRWDEIKMIPANPSVRVSSLSRLARVLSDQNIAELREVLDEVMEPVSGQYVKKSHINSLLSAIMNVASEHMIACGFTLDQLQNIPHDAESVLAVCADLAGVKYVICELYARVIEYVQSSRTDMNAVIIKARLYIQENYMRQISLGDIAVACNVSPAYLSKQFKQKTSQNIVNYIEELRLVKARTMIDESPDTPLSEICGAVGYVDQYYFSKRFKARFGVSPRRYTEDRLSRKMK